MNFYNGVCWRACPGGIVCGPGAGDPCPGDTKSIEIHKHLKVHETDDDTIRFTSLVTLEDADGATKTVFIGPIEGGLKIEHRGKEIVVITPGSPMGRELLGKSVGDAIKIEAGTSRAEYEIVKVC